jgi:nucleotide-binding universal stress UspA family protein
MPPERDSGDRVLIAYDGSNFAKAAIEQAGRQLRSGRPATVLTVVEPLESVPFWLGPTATVPAEILEEVTGRAEKTVEEGTELARAAGFEAESLLDQGTPIWSRIVHVAQELDAGVIVLGSHGRTGVKSALMGSVATAVAHHARRPVMISHAGGEG